MTMIDFHNAFRMIAGKERIPAHVQPSLVNFMQISERVTDISPLNYVRQYTLCAKFEVHVSIDDQAPDALSEAVRDARSMIGQAVFGDLKLEVMRAKHAIHNGKYAEAQQVLRGILDGMDGK